MKVLFPELSKLKYDEHLLTIQDSPACLPALSHTAEGKFRHGSTLRPQFGKDNDRIINEYQQQEENQKVISSYREHFYRKQGDRLLQHARGEHASGQQGDDLFNLFQNNNQDFRNKHLAQLKQVGNPAVLCRGWSLLRLL